MWEDNAATRNIQEKIVDPQQTAKLVYDVTVVLDSSQEQQSAYAEEVAANAALQEEGSRSRTTGCPTQP